MAVGGRHRISHWPRFYRTGVSFVLWLGPGLGSEDRIPERRANSEGSVVVLEVVAHVKLAQLATERGLRTVMVHVVMEHVVEEVTGEEPAPKDQPRAAWKDSPKEQQEAAREGDAGRGWHDQSKRIVWVVVVDAVDHEVESMRPFVVSVKVEDETMKPIFGECPEKPAT